MKRFITATAIALSIAIPSFAQGVYDIKDVKVNPATPVKDQANSGTCWSYATTSFVESELLRTGKGEFDLSEIFIVRYNYINRLQDNYFRRGKGNLGQGSLAHMFFNVFKEKGIVPQEIYNGINYNSPKNNHSELNKYLNVIAGASVELKQRSAEYNKLMNSLLDIYLGEVPSSFEYKGVEYTPKSFAKELGIDADNYIEITSLSHLPYYESVVIEVPDNWDYGRFYNLPIDEFMEVMNYAIDKGHTICWDGDVSETGFMHSKGIAINPELPKDVKGPAFQQLYSLKSIVPEINVNDSIRNLGYESFKTTDDHLMHITGVAKDANGNIYYKTKNSWDTDSNQFGGYLYMSESFVRAKSISILVHKDAIPASIKKSLKIK